MVGSAAQAEPEPPSAALSGAEFEAHVTGHTIEFEVEGQSYGVEQYLTGRRVIWAFDGGPCREGIWYEPEPQLICFEYTYDPVPQCWRFFDRQGRLMALFEDAAPGAPLIEARRSRAAMSCPGPDVGV